VINEPFGSIAVHKKVGKIVSLLADLPPDGKWKSHPCCCVCATEKAIAANREEMKTLLELLHATTGFILEDRERAAKLTSKWTKQPEAVESRSVPNIAYMRKADETYRVGLETWFGMMMDLGQFKGRLKDLSYADAFALCHDLSLLEEVVADR
jgi:NitT/TauT family transport system substrate-binding protein